MFSCYCCHFKLLLLTGTVSREKYGVYYMGCCFISSKQWSANLFYIFAHPLSKSYYKLENCTPSLDKSCIPTSWNLLRYACQLVSIKELELAPPRMSIGVHQRAGTCSATHANWCPSKSWNLLRQACQLVSVKELTIYNSECEHTVTLLKLFA